VFILWTGSRLFAIREWPLADVRSLLHTEVLLSNVPGVGLETTQVECLRRKEAAEEFELHIVHAMNMFERRLVQTGLMTAKAAKDSRVKMMRSTNEEDGTKALKKQLRRNLDICTDNQSRKLVKDWPETETFRRAFAKHVTCDANSKVTFLNLRKVFESYFAN